jgi:hypothetical protein
MTWLKFIYWLTGLYSFYYIGNILWDMARGKKTSAEHNEELHFGEQTLPQKVEAEKKEAKKVPPPVKGEPFISAIGGVGLKDLFNLAKAEVIAYNRAVSF